MTESPANDGGMTEEETNAVFDRFARDAATIAALENRNAELVEALKLADEGLDTWIQTYAPEFCDKEHVKVARSRITHGTLSYIAEISSAVGNALAKHKSEGIQK